MFFRLSSLELLLFIVAIVIGATFVGIFFGHRLRAHAATLKEPVGVVQAALLGLVALLLAFGLTMAVGRYDGRRAAVVDDANAIGTPTCARRPCASRSGAVARRARPLCGRQPPPLAGRAGNQGATKVDRRRGRTPTKLWRQAGEALAGSPTDSAPRLYVDSLNT